MPLAVVWPDRHSGGREEAADATRKAFSGMHEIKEVMNAKRQHQYDEYEMACCMCGVGGACLVGYL